MNSQRFPHRWLVYASFIAFCCLPIRVAAQFGFNPGDIPGFPGGEDLPAMLLFSDPATGASNVALDKPVVFTFFTAMSPVQKVDWSGNLDPSKFTYKWSADGKTLTSTYTGNFPASSTITWTLDPAVFKDTAGNALLPFNNSGTFTTGTGTGSGPGDPNDPCNGGDGDSEGGVASLIKTVQYLQTGTGAPVLDGDLAATFGLFVRAAVTNPVSQASLQLPNGTVKPLTSLFGSFFLSEEFASEAAMDAAYPGGVYTLNLQQVTGSASIKLNMPSSAPPTPHLSNFAEVQAFNPTADLTVRWDAFTGATANDGISFEMHDSTVQFHAPDLCVPRPLANTDTSIIVPKNTFGAGTEVDGSLTFSKSGGFDTNSIPGLSGFAGYSKTTTFKPSGSTNPGPDAPLLQNLVRQPDGTVRFQVKGTAASMVVEGSTDLKVWLPVLTAPSPTGLLDVTDSQTAGNARRFYRATAR